jgi:hypothetical protein
MYCIKQSLTWVLGRIKHSLQVTRLKNILKIHKLELVIIS